MKSTGVICVTFLWFSFSARSSNALQLLSATGTNYTTTNTGNVYSSYQGQSYCTPSARIQYPKSVAEVQAIVKSAVQNGKTVKALGSRHSVTDVICTEGIPIAMTNINYTRFNNDDTVTIGTGLELSDALQAMHVKNRTLIHCPTFGGITIGGAVGTGAHGSSLIHAPSISDQVVRVTIVDSQGNIVEISDAEELKAFRVHLGLLGILIDVTLTTVPVFKMTIENSLQSESILTDGTALRWARTYDTFSIWWFPSTASVVVAKGTYLNDTRVAGDAETFLIPDESPAAVTTVSGGVDTLQELRNTVGLEAFQEFTQFSLIEQVVGKPPIYSDDGGNTIANPATGYAWKLLQNRCEQCAWSAGDSSFLPEDFSVSVDVNEFQNAVKTVKNILTQTNSRFYMIGIYLRFSKASDSFMATSSGRDIVDFEWVSAMRKDPLNKPKHGLGGYQAIQQALVNVHGGRSHWGKNGLYYLGKDVLQKTAVNKAQFIQVMQKYDPTGLLANKFRARLLGTSNDMNINPLATKCALQDSCVCQKNSDCATLQKCGQIGGYSVCQDILGYPDLPGSYDPKNLTSILVAFGLLPVQLNINNSAQSTI